jgi:hypothetical protein
MWRHRQFSAAGAANPVVTPIRATGLQSLYSSSLEPSPWSSKIYLNTAGFVAAVDSFRNGTEVAFHIIPFRDLR